MGNGLCFNALAGIFCFLADKPTKDGIGIISEGFNALAGIFCFLALVTAKEAL